MTSTSLLKVTLFLQQIEPVSEPLRSQQTREVNNIRKTSQEHKDIYSPMTFKSTQEFVLVSFHSYSGSKNSQNITIKKYIIYIH